MEHETTKTKAKKKKKRKKNGERNTCQLRLLSDTLPRAYIGQV